MRIILFLGFIILTTNGQFQSFQQQRMLPMLQNNVQPGFNDGLRLQSGIRIPFPQCLTTERASEILNPTTLLNIFQMKLLGEDRKLRQERVRNDDANNSMNFINYLFKRKTNGFFLFSGYYGF
jgi:hypothetical protein